MELGVRSLLQGKKGLLVSLVGSEGHFHSRLSLKVATSIGVVGKVEDRKWGGQEMGAATLEGGHLLAHSRYLNKQCVSKHVIKTPRSLCNLKERKTSLRMTEI